MSQPVYLLVIGKGWNEAWYQLSKEEQDSLWSKVDEVDKRAGGKVIIGCNSRRADEEIDDWAVLEYPDMETYQKKVQELEELDWWRYFSQKQYWEQKWNGDRHNPKRKGSPFLTVGKDDADQSPWTILAFPESSLFPVLMGKERQFNFRRQFALVDRPSLRG